MSGTFKHINAGEQIFDGSITASLLAPTAAVSTIHSDANLNLTGNVQLVSGANITLSQVGQVITVNSTGELSATLTNSHIFVGNASNVATDVPLSGDATITNTGALTIVSVGGSSPANIHSAELAANAATNLNTPSTIVKRDSSGNFSAGVITVGDIHTTGSIFVTNAGHTNLGAFAQLTPIASTTYLDFFTNIPGNYTIVGNSSDGTLRLSADNIELLKLDGNFSVVYIEAPLNMGQNQILNLVLQKGTSEPVSPAEGQVFYRTDTHQAELWNGSSWVILG